MLNGQTLLATLERQQITRHGPTVWRVVSHIIGLLLIVAMVGAILAIIGYRLWLGWETGQWAGFWMLAVVSFCFVILPIFAVIPEVSQSQRFLPALAPLREIAAAREDALTPLVVPQPPALLAEAMPPGVIEIGPLKPLLIAPGQRTSSMMPLSVVIACFAFIFVLTGINDLDLGPILSNSFALLNLEAPYRNFLLTALIGLFALGFCVPIIGGVARARARRPTMTVMADADGLRWRAERGGVEHAIAWRDVRSFSRVVNGGAGTLSPYGAFNLALGVVYLLDGPDASLIWTMAPTYSDTLYGASDHLCRLVVSRTDLPLRDLTAIVNELAATGGNVKQLTRTRALSGGANPPSPTLEALIARQTPPAPPRVWRRVAPVLVALLIPLLLSAAIFGYGGWVEHYQQGYFASLPQQVNAENALYADTLLSDDGDWYVGPVTAKVHQGARYANNAYQLYGNDPTQGNWVWTYEAPLVRDAAFQVTVSEQGTIASGASDGIGLLFNIDHNGNNFSLFQVNADGSWYLYAYHFDANNQPNSWNDVVNGSSSAIHQGLGATNTLLVIKRGQVCLLYVNAHLIETYYDRENVLPLVGSVGMFMNDDAQTGTFSNVAVYPVQPPSAQWYV